MCMKLGIFNEYKYLLFNIRTGEIYKINATLDEMIRVVKYLVIKKFSPEKENDNDKFVADNKIVVSKSKDGNKYDFSFSPSALAINPVNNKVYVLSGSELLLFVFDTRGTIESVIPLGQDLFTQPEGIAFERNGDMLISNEGQKKNPTILRFRYLTR